MDIANFTRFTDHLPGLRQHADLSAWLDQEGLCLLVDAALAGHLLEPLYAERDADGWAIEPLYRQTPWQASADVGPHLIKVWRGGSAIGALLEHLGNAPVGIALLPDSNTHWQALCSHCRRWLSIDTGKHTPMQLRWFDPRWIRALLTVLSPVQRRALAGPCEAFAWHDGLTWQHWATDQSPAPEPSSPPLFDTTLCARLQAERLWDTAASLTLDYHHALAPADREAALQRVHTALCRAQQQGFTQKALQERWLRLTLVQGEGFDSRSHETRSLLAAIERPPADRLAHIEALYRPGATP